MLPSLLHLECRIKSIMGRFIRRIRRNFLPGLAGFFVVVCLLFVLFASTIKQQPPFQLATNESYSRADVTLVTAYFPQGNRSKHSEADYAKWMTNLLQSLETPVIVFTVNQSARYIAGLRQGKRTHVVVLKDVWSTQLSSKWKAAYPSMHAKDPEKSIHYPELYAIWNLKPWFLLQGSKMNPFFSSYFFWMDIGSVREETTRLIHFPDVAKVKSTFRWNEDKMHLFAVSRFVRSGLGSPLLEKCGANFIIAGFFGGMERGIRTYADRYYQQHDRFLSQGKFVGKEQNLMNWDALTNSNLVMITSSSDQTTPGCGDHWFYFQRWYARREEVQDSCTPNATTRRVEELIDTSNL